MMVRDTLKWLASCCSANFVPGISRRHAIERVRVETISSVEVLLIAVIRVLKLDICNYLVCKIEYKENLSYRFLRLNLVFKCYLRGSMTVSEI